MSVKPFAARIGEPLFTLRANLVPTGTETAALLAGAGVSHVVASRDRALTGFFFMDAGNLLHIDIGRGPNIFDGLATSLPAREDGSFARETRSIGVSLKILTKGTAERVKADIGLGRAGHEAMALAARGQRLLVAAVTCNVGDWPEGDHGQVVGASVNMVRWHDVAPVLKGTDVPYLVRSVEAAEMLPAGHVRTIESSKGVNAWWRKDGAYWRLAVRLDGSNALTGWEPVALAAERAREYAKAWGTLPAARSAADFSCGTLRLWTRKGHDGKVVSGTFRNTGEREVVTVRPVLVKVLTRLMDGEWHPTADMVAEFGSSTRVNVQKLNEALAGKGWEVTNRRANKANRDTGEHGYRLRRA